METFRWWYYSAYMEEKNAIKYPRNVDKFQVSHYLL
nr:MAG TPA: hypothetical protein [Caudoviricetes sp.]